jgi:exodeoxyribonuclease VII small subunit
MKKAPATSISPVARFESALKELEDIVARMERGELPLEESLQLFERGTQLGRQCRDALDAAELKVKNLLEAVKAADAGEPAA